MAIEVAPIARDSESVRGSTFNTVSMICEGAASSIRIDEGHLIDPGKRRSRPWMRSEKYRRIRNWSPLAVVIAAR